jgi:imidazolonepropionase-like amidohydrolase
MLLGDDALVHDESRRLEMIVNKASTIAFVLAATLGSISIGHGQSRQVPAPPQQRTVTIHSATVHPVSGDVIENGYVTFEDGRITQIGSGKAPRVRDADQFDATGLHVYPGLIEPFTNLGLTEVGAVAVTHDSSELGNFKPEVRAAVALNPDSDLIPVARSNGILTAMIRPEGGLVSGQAAVIRLDGWTWEDLAIDDRAGLIVSWPRTEPIDARWMEKSREEQLKEIDKGLREVERKFDESQSYIKAHDADPTLKTDLRHEAMRPYLLGEKPVYVRASSIGQIESAVAWGQRRKLNIVIVGGHEADLVIPLLKKHDIPVIIGGLHRLPGRRHSAYDQAFALPAVLHEAGIRFCISSATEAAHIRSLNHVAATAVAYGLPKEIALQAVTQSAAELLGVGDTLGTIDRGKSATLIVTNGDPLEITTDTLVAFIDGRRIDLGDRQKTLYRKYRSRYVQLGLLEE